MICYRSVYNLVLFCDSFEIRIDYECYSLLTIMVVELQHVFPFFGIFIVCLPLIIKHVAVCFSNKSFDEKHCRQLRQKCLRC